MKFDFSTRLLAALGSQSEGAPVDGLPRFSPTGIASAVAPGKLRIHVAMGAGPVTARPLSTVDFKVLLASEDHRATNRAGSQ